MSAPEGLRIAVLGCGRWGRLIVDDLISLGAAVHVVDPDPAAQLSARQRSATASASIDGCERVDAVVIATPASGHAIDIESVAELGVPIACEKPLTTSAAAAKRTLDTVGDRLTVLHVWRYHHGVERLRRLIEEGALGDVALLRTNRTNWTSPRTDVDPVWTLLPHDLSIAVELFGEAPSPVDAVVEQIDDRAVGIWAHCVTSAGVPCIFEASTRYERRQRTIRVHGDQAVAVLDPDAATLELYSGLAGEPVRTAIPYDPAPALCRELHAFLDHVAGGPPPKTSGAEGVAVVAAVEQTLTIARQPGGGPR
ncbi:MAG: Gfo/Idh/MocA family oxidoreductase [Actinomycetota bacterium]